MITVLIIGQSNAQKMGTEGSDLTPHANLTEWDGISAFVAPTTNGHIAYGNAMIAATGDSVRIINAGVGSTALLAAADTVGYWLDLTASEPYDLAKTKVTAAVSSLTIDAVLWSQGVRDAQSGLVSSSQYSTAFQSFITDQIRSDFTNASSLDDIPVVFMPLGRNTAPGNDANWQAIREGQKDAVANLDNCLLSATTLDLEMAPADDVHYSDDGQTKLGARAALAHQALLGLISEHLGPDIIKSNAISDTQTRVTIDQRSGTGFTPTSAITGFEVSIDNFSTTETLSAVARESATTLLITHGSIAIIERKIRHLYGASPDISASINDNSLNSLPLEWIGGLTETTSSSIDVYLQSNNEYSSYPTDSKLLPSVIYTPLSEWVGYDFLSGNLSDESGNEGDFVSNGTGTPFADPKQYLPNGTDNYLEVAAPTVVPRLLDMSTLNDNDGEQIIIKVVMNISLDTGGRSIVSLGKNGFSGIGSFSLEVTDGEGFQLNMRAIGATSNNTEQFTSFSLTDFSLTGKEVSIVFSIYGAGNDTAQCMAYVGVDGSSYNYTNIGSFDLIDTAAGGTTPINETDTDVRFIVGARGATGESNFQSAGMSSLKIIRRSSIDHLAVARYAYASATTMREEPEEISVL